MLVAVVVPCCCCLLLLHPAASCCHHKHKRTLCRTLLQPNVPRLQKAPWPHPQRRPPHAACRQLACPGACACTWGPLRLRTVASLVAWWARGSQSSRKVLLKTDVTKTTLVQTTKGQFLSFDGGVWAHVLMLLLTTPSLDLNFEQHRAAGQPMVLLESFHTAVTGTPSQSPSPSLGVPSKE